MASFRAAAIDIVSRGSVTRWRIVGGTQLQRSNDGGVEWRTIEFAPVAPLVGGHSPTGDVLWLVGRSGTIYVTTDGVKFDHVPFADGTDLASVVAVNDREAIVTTIDGRSFRTTDRGLTWLQL